MTRKIAVFTGTRAEYGLLYWLLKGIEESPKLSLQLIAGAMHFSPEFGETWRDIERDGFHIDARVEMLLSSDSAVGVLKSMGLGVIGMADALDRLRPDALVVLGDRFEALAAAQSALILGIPLVHIHGGEVTEGAYDDAIRHAVTKMASLHFTATEAYRRRVIQMGEAPDRVFNVGALGLDHLLHGDKMQWDELCKSIEFDLKPPYFLLTYHAATNAAEDPATAMKAIFDALDQFPDHQILITYPNADNGGRAIITEIEQFAVSAPLRVHAVPSLGFRRYLTALGGAAAVIGNSSSAIIEAPSFGVPSLNIGARQKGRLASESVVHVESIEPAEIAAALSILLSSEHAALTRSAVNPYGQGNACAAIVRQLEAAQLTATKKFHDIESAT